LRWRVLFSKLSTLLNIRDFIHNPLRSGQPVAESGNSAS
jgi:hypothetical protein